MSSRPPSVLVRLLSARDPATRDRAWETFVEKYTPLLISTASRFGGDREATMDRYTYILEELHRDDFKRLRRYAADGRSRFTTWLVVVARRLCLDHQRRRYGRPRTEATGIVEVQRVIRKRLADFVAEDLDLASGLSANGGRPDEEVRAAELRTALNDALRTLPSRDRLLLAFRYEEEMSAREIAQLLDLPSVFHVYRRLNAIHGVLREILERKGVRDADP